MYMIECAGMGALHSVGSCGHRHVAARPPLRRVPGNACRAYSCRQRPCQLPWSACRPPAAAPGALRPTCSIGACQAAMLLSRLTGADCATAPRHTCTIMYHAGCLYVQATDCRMNKHAGAAPNSSSHCGALPGVTSAHWRICTPCTAYCRHTARIALLHAGAPPLCSAQQHSPTGPFRSSSTALQRGPHRDWPLHTAFVDIHHAW